MIKVVKPAAPPDVAAKCDRATATLKIVAAALRKRYTEQDPATGVVLTDADRIAILVAVDPTLKASAPPDSATADVKKQFVARNAAKLPDLANVVFKAFGVERLVTTPTAKDIEGRFGDWRTRNAALQSWAAEIRSTTEKAWALQCSAWFDRRFPTTAAADRQRVMGEVCTLYRVQAVATGQPFLTGYEAQAPTWFDPAVLGGIVTFSGVPRELTAELLQAYQGVLEARRAALLSTGAPARLAAVVWMAPNGAAAPAEAALFDRVRQVFTQRITDGASLGPTVTAQEMAAEQANAAGGLSVFLAVQAFGEVLREWLGSSPRAVDYEPMIGYSSKEFASALYSGGGVKEALMNAQHGKCVFCESKVRALAHGDVEHFRPKATDDTGHRFYRDGYFWLAYAWSNLYYSCQVCNQTYKGTQFPLLDDGKGNVVRRTAEHDDAPELPLLIDPGIEDPRRYVRFDPRTGVAYPFDLVGEYLSRNGVANPEEAIWADPSRIPGMVGQYTVDRSGTAVRDTQGHPLWNQMQTFPRSSMRGLTTIMLLGLNRPELVLRRVAHLRGLRGLYVAAVGNGAEKAAAVAALGAAAGEAGEFSSLTVDAVATWQRESGAPRSWVANHTALLAVEPLYSHIEDDPFGDVGNAAVMYFIDAANRSGPRRVVYLPEKDELETRTDHGKGWYMAIPDEDTDLVATIVDAKKGTTTTSTLGALLALDGRSLRFRLAEHCRATVDRGFSSDIRL